MPARPAGSAGPLPSASPPRGPGWCWPRAGFQRVLDVDIAGYVNGARTALTHFRGQGPGVLINVSELRLDGIPGVSVCTVMPAAIDTPFFQHAANCTGRGAEGLCRRRLAWPPPDSAAPVFTGLLAAGAVVLLRKHIR